MKVTERVKVSTYLPAEADAKLERLMEKTGMTKSKVVALAVVAGLDALVMAFDPSMKSYFDALQKTWGDDVETN